MSQGQSKIPITIEFVDASDTRRRVSFRPMASGHERTTAILDVGGDVERVTGREFVSEISVDIGGREVTLDSPNRAATTYRGP